MNLIPTPLIRHNARCKDCGYGFTVYAFSDFEYGQKLGRTPNPRELGLLDTFNYVNGTERAEELERMLTAGIPNLRRLRRETLERLR
ncbi:MAG: hypothetical protein J7452_07650 [Thermoflexus sp.]|jgi:hypothetical protein|nr:hypothetical protein [Thermoflexus sp.]